MIEGIVREAIEVWAVVSRYPYAETCAVQLMIELENPQNELNIPTHVNELCFFDWLKLEVNNTKAIDIAWLQNQSIEVIEALFPVFGRFPKGYAQAKALHDMIIQGISGEDLIVRHANSVLKNFSIENEPVLLNSIKHMFNCSKGALMNVAMIAGINAQKHFEERLGIQTTELILAKSPLSGAPSKLEEACISAFAVTVKKEMIHAIVDHFKKKRQAFRSMLFQTLCVHTETHGTDAHPI